MFRWKLISERFELEADFCGALRYEDSDGDLISVSTDEEVEEALRLCGDGTTLKMTLTSSVPQPCKGAEEAAQNSDVVGKAWAGALSEGAASQEVVAEERPASLRASC